MSFYQNLLDKISLLERQTSDRDLQKSHMPWYLNSPKGGKARLPWYVYAEDLPGKLKLRYYKTLLALTRIWMIIKGVPSSNFWIFTQAGKDGIYICNYSYCYYKGYHKNTKWKFLTMVTSATIIVSLIVALIFPGEPRAMAAVHPWVQTNWSTEDANAVATDTAQRVNEIPWTKYSAKTPSVAGSASDVKLNTVIDSWTQTSWIGSGSASTASHANANQTNWTDYSSKDTSVSLDIAGEISTSASSGGPTIPWTQPTTTNFSAAGYSINTTSGNLSISGSGAGESLVTCDYNHGGVSWTPTNGDAWDLDASANIGIAGVHCNINVFTVAAGTTYVYGYDGTSYGKLIVYAASSTITGTLSADGKGYAGVYQASGSGTGGGNGGLGTVGAGGGGAAYGGNGGNGWGSNTSYAGSTIVYGSATQPTELGSAGGGTSLTTGGNGGGAVKLIVSGTLTLDGSIVAKGGNGNTNSTSKSAGGGAGGSIWIDALSIAGTTG
ncbi:MAG: hypothetical protein Q8N37_02870, partial [bacterium]|nr:hypothetical protein [bacterium]